MTTNETPSPFCASVTDENMWERSSPVYPLKLPFKRSASPILIKEYPIDSIETIEDIPIKIICRPTWNSKMRSKEFGCLEFGVVWKNGGFTTEPIWNLIDIDDKSVNEKILPILRFYNETTKNYPTIKRQCWFCKRYCIKGKDICCSHYTELDWIYSAIMPDITELDSVFVDPVGISMIGLKLSD